MKATDDVLETGGKNVVRLPKLGDKDSEDANDISSTRSAASPRIMRRKSDSSDDKSASNLKVSRRTYDKATVSVVGGLDPIDEHGFSRNLPNDQKARIRCTTSVMRMPYGTPLRSHALIDRDCLQICQEWDKMDTNLSNRLKMTLDTSEKSKIILVLGGTNCHQRGLIGRDTCVVLACSSTRPDSELVVKTSWPSIHRDSEKNAANVKADEMAGEGKRHWILDHLPEIRHSQDFRSNDEDMSQRRLLKMLNDEEYADEKPFIYDEHLRITFSGRLFSITDLTDVKDIGQVSKKNIRILGVLNDFDLSSVIPLQEATSLHRTGTPPYMAYELLGQSNVGYLYRHDVEAFYYVLLMLCCRYEIVRSPAGKVMKELSEDKKDLPFEEWYDRTTSWEILAQVKLSFFFSLEPIPPSKSFSVFLPWLNDFRFLFRQGLFALANSKHPQTSLSSHLKPPESSTPFDNETIGGYIIPAEILKTISKLDGHSLSDQ
ncbi:hypothetical protein IW261DRAFT_1635265 [Armillaria novae-zelandiae]|uniref:Fungal-type protein kinase domain-containing protein n=1 Tax=Armillaria novae-zelandiae TaxID=153914 RepID=A0AA39KJ33_9AGAR|nr:hypothetical protein IW261DRAFT_1635265 [Armillaria novae-zelandiae]